MVNCFNFRTIHILIEQATFLLHCFMYTLAFVDKIIIKPKCPRNVTTLGHFRRKTATGSFIGTLLRKDLRRAAENDRPPHSILSAA